MAAEMGFTIIDGTSRAGSDSSDADSEDRQWVMPEHDIESDDERVFHCSRMGLMPATLALFAKNGYNVWTSQVGGGIAETSQQDWDKMGILRGEQERLAHGLREFHESREDFYHRAGLPSGSLSQGLRVPVPSLQGPAATGIPSPSVPAGPAATDVAAPRAPATFLQGPIGPGAPAMQEPVAIEHAAANEVSFGIFWLVMWAMMRGNFRAARTHMRAALEPQNRTWTLAIALVFLAVALAIFGLPMIFVGGAAAAGGTAAPVITTAVMAECVDGDTLVLTVDRKWVPIRELKKGDYVLAWSKRKCVVRQVLDLTINTVSSDYVRRITFGNVMSILATCNHPFWIHGKKWCSVDPEEQAAMKAKKLEIGDCGISMVGTKVPVTSIETVSRSDDSIQVFNILVQSPGTWFANGLLTHSGMWAQTEYQRP